MNQHASRNTDFRAILANSLLACILGLAITGCPNNTGIDPNQFTSAASIQNDPTVQAAIKTLTDAGKTMPFLAGSTPPIIEGTWKIALGTITHTQAGTANAVLPNGRDVFTAQGGGTIQWSATRDGGVSGESLKGFVSGSGAGITVSLFGNIRAANAITGLTDCLTQNAVFYTLTQSPDGQALSGTFLVVNLLTVTGSCSVAGNFDFGTIQFSKVDTDTPKLEAVATIPVGLSDPTSIVLSSTGSFGYVGTASNQVIRFDVVAKKTTAITMPSPNGFSSIGPLAISAGNSNVGFITAGDNRFLGFNTTGGNSQLEGQVFPPTVPSPATFLAVAPLYNAVADVGYFPVAFQNQRPAIGLANPRNSATPIGLSGTISFGQDGLSLMRMRPDFKQISAVLIGGALSGGARFVGFADITNNTLTKEVDVTSPTFNDFHADQLVYSADSSSVFTLNDQQVVGIQSGGSFGLVTTNDLRDGASDVLRHVAVSDDGKTLAVTISAIGGGSSLVILNPTTLAEIHRQHYSGGVKAAGGHLVYLPGTRIAVVEDGAGNVTPINTASPFFAGATVPAFANAFTTNISGVAVGGGVVAALNRSEKAVYIYQLSNP